MSSKYDQYKMYLKPVHQRLYEKGMLSEDEMSRLGEEALSEFKSRKSTPATIEDTAMGPLTPGEQSYLDAGETGTLGAVGRSMSVGAQGGARGIYEAGRDALFPASPGSGVSMFNDPVTNAATAASNSLLRFIAGDEIDDARKQFKADDWQAQDDFRGQMGRVQDASAKGNAAEKTFIKYAPAVVQAAPLALAAYTRKPALAKAAIAGLAAQGFGQEYSETIGDISTKKNRALAGAGIEVLSERLGIKGADAVGVFKQLGHMAVGEGGTELLAEQMRQLRDLAGFQEHAPKTNAESFERQVDAFIGGKLAGGAIGALGGAKMESNRVRGERTKELRSVMDSLKEDIQQDVQDFNPILDSDLSDTSGWDGSGEQPDLFPAKPKKEKPKGYKVEDMFAPGNFRDAGTPMAPDPKELSAIQKAREAAIKLTDAQAKKQATKDANANKKYVQDLIKANPNATDAELAALLRAKPPAAATAPKTDVTVARNATASRADALRKGGQYSITDAASDGLSIDGVVDRLAGDDSRVGRAARNAITSGKLKVVENDSQLPEAARGNNAGGYFDGETTYIVADKHDKDTLIPSMIHEVKHWYDSNSDTKSKPRSFKNVVGEEANTRLITQLEAKKGTNAIVDRAFERFEKVKDKVADKDELVTYFVEEAARAKAKGGVLGTAKTIVNDVVASTKAFMADKLGEDLGVSLNDLDYMSRKLFDSYSKEKPAGTTGSAGKFSLVGPTAKNAERYEKEGRGFEGAVDKKRRYEIDSSQAKIKSATSGKLSDVLQYDELYENYPDLADTPISFEKIDGGGEWNGTTLKVNSVLLNNKEMARSVILHELQHAIQTKEGFTRGGSPEMMLTDKERTDRNIALSAMKQAQGRIKDFDKIDADSPAMKKYNTYSKIVEQLDAVADKRYKAIGGEAEARAVQNRMKLTQAERKETPFYKSLDNGLTPDKLTKSPNDPKPVRSKFSISDKKDISYPKDNDFGKKKTAKVDTLKKTKDGKPQILHPDSTKAKAAELWDKITSKAKSKVPTSIKRARDIQGGAVREAQLRALNTLNDVNEELTKVKDQDALIAEVQAYEAIPADNTHARQRAMNKIEAKHPAFAVAYKKLRRQIFENSVDIADMLTRDVSRMSEKDKAMVNKINENLGEYISRSYALFGNSKQKDAHMAFLKGTTAGKEVIKEARAFVKKHVASIPANLDKTGRDHLETLYDMYIGRGKKVEELPTEFLRSELEKVRNVAKGEKLDLAVDSIMEDLITIGNRKKFLSKAGQMFRNIKQDVTIVTGRDNVPEAIRKLWGEQTDPVMSAFVTLTRQGEFLARIKEQQRLLDDFDGQFFFDSELGRPGTKLEKLTGETWGPLEGKFTTPEVKNYLDMKKTAAASIASFVEAWNDAEAIGDYKAVAQEAGKLSLRGLAWAGGKIKWATVVAKPMNFAYNFIGSPIQLLANGNFIPGKTNALKGMAIAFKKLPGAAYKGATDEQVAELIRNNIQDSAFIGELQEAELNALIQRFSEGTTATSKLRKGVDRVTDYYAAADLYAKIANYLKEKEFVASYYKTLGEKVTPADIERIAAERTQQTNFSFNRAWGPARFLEQGGITNFLTYNAEVFRTIYGNFALGIKDIQAARKMENKEAAALMMTHGTKRLAGAGAALTLTHAAFYGLGAMVSAVLGMEEDEREELIKKYGLPDFLADSIPALVGVNGTERVYFDVSRLDPYGPLNELVRSAYSGDGDQVVDSAASLWIMNAALDTLAQSTGIKKPKQPRTKNASPDVYEYLREQTVGNGLSQGAFDWGLRTVETISPSILTSLPVALGGTVLEGDDKGAMRLFLESIGVSVIRYRPEEDLKRDARNVLGKTLNESRQAWSNFVAANKELDSEDVLEEFIAINEDEYEAWIEMEGKVKAAELAGLTRRQLNEVLKDSDSVNTAQRTSLLSGRYSPSAISPEKLEQDKATEIKNAKGDRDKLAQINRKYRFLRGEVLRYNRNFRDLSEDN